MKQIITLMGLLIALTRLEAQTTTSFNFSASSHTVSGWTNIAGDPSTAVRSGSSGGITVSSIATANWVPIPGTGSAFDGVGASGGTFFPSGVMSNHWFQYSALGEYNAAVPQLQISGLNKDSVYTVKMTGSSTSSFGTNPTQYTVAGKTVDGYIDVNTHGNTASGATFNNIAPDTNGVIHVYINTVPSTDVGDICGIQITPGHTTPPPTITITSPDNNDVLSEEGNVTINAVASESGGTIVKVQFFVGDTTKIGESTTAPYSATWTNPDEGNYKITATAVDANGVSNSTSINVSVESLSGFWSMTGNIKVNSDSFFIGTVDTSRFVVRTKNIPRLTIDSGGNVNIALKHPSAFTIKKSADTSAAHPAFKVYDNGDLVAGTTMDTSTNTAAQTGLRYYSKLGLLQVGATDRIDTTVAIDPTWPGGGILINSKNANSLKGRIIDSYVGGNTFTIDSNVRFAESILTGQNTQIKASCDDCLIGGYGHRVNAPLTNAILTGNGNVINHPTEGVIVSGFVNTTRDTSYESIINGGLNQFGGNGQLVSGNYLINRTPFGSVLGNSNVDFATQAFTGRRGVTVAGISNYPLFALGNSSTNDSSIRSNAITVLYNGRTQINSTGFANTLTQTAVTPKAALEVVSTNSGVLLPKLTTAQRNAIVSGDLISGLLIYNTDSSVFQFYNGSAWTSVGSGAGGGGRWQFSGGTVYDSVDNIAIGTSAVPSGYKLAVNGTAIFTKVRVKTAGTWPDYVFKRNYTLLSLEELERYIATNNHLPGIIPEGPAERDGIDVAENQAALLKKVEELTLYLINENKKLKEQNRQLQQQIGKNGQQDARLDQLQKEIDELKAMIRKGN